MSVEKNIEIVKRFTEDVINQHKFELINEFWATDLKWHGGFMVKSTELKITERC